MSSKLIGELSQVGLTITQTPVDRSNDDHLSDESGVGRVSDSSEPDIKRQCRTRQKRFRQEWMMFDIFKDWLKPHPKPELASCTVCNRVIKAGKSELEKHATGQRHLRMLQIIKSESEIQTSETTEIVLNDIVINDTVSSDTISPSKDHTYDNSIPPDEPEDITYVPKVLVTRPAPHWKSTAIVNGHITKLDLNGYKGRYVILFFYCNDFSTVCASEIFALNDRIQDFRALKTEVVACSTDSHLTHLAWVNTPREAGGLGNPKFPLLADPNHQIAKDYGVLLPEKGHALKGTFIIDHKSIVRYSSINEPQMGRGIDDILKIIKALQYLDINDEPLVANWSIVKIPSQGSDGNQCRTTTIDIT